MLKYGSLFTGVEGFDLGFNNTGMKCEWQIEIDRWCQAVLKYNSPDTEKFLNVKEVGKRNLRSVDLICGGFPCQDLSVAGKRNGLDGERSGLWFEFARIIAELKPAWIVIENVPGLLSSNKGEDFAVILRWLGECGYYASWRILDSQYWGVAQRRRRVFIVGSLGNTGCAKVLFESEGLPWNPPKSRKKGEETSGSLGSHTSGGWGNDLDNQGAFVTGTLPAEYGNQGGNGMAQMDNGLISATETGHGFWKEGKPMLAGNAPSRQQTIVAFQSKASSQNTMNPSDKVPALSVGKAGGSAIAFTERTRKEGRNFESQDELAYSLTNPGSGGRSHSRQIAGKFGVRRLTPRECERLQGFPDDWTRYGINEKAEKIEISDSQRYKMLGNAVTASVSEWIGRRIVEAMKP